MTILLTGGFGKTASRIANILHSRSIPIVLTSRRGQAGIPAPFKGVTFNWADQSTWSNAFNEATDIDAVYIVAPDEGGEEGIQQVKSFINFAKDKGVKRFVLLSASVLEKGGLGNGLLHEYIVELGVDYAVLRPSWFFENFLDIIAPDGTISTCTGDGKVGFISSDDIADVAVNALTNPISPNTDHIIVGPELLSYDQAAEQLSTVLGKKVTHKKITEEEYTKLAIGFGLPESFAAALANFNHQVSTGLEERIYARKGNVIGKVNLLRFIELNKKALSEKIA